MILTVLLLINNQLIDSVIFEQRTFFDSMYFAIGAMSAAGIPTPHCVDGDDELPTATCQLGNVHGFALGVYIIIGVPLFAFMIGHISGYVVETVALAKFKRISRQDSLERLDIVEDDDSINGEPCIDSMRNNAIFTVNELTSRGYEIPSFVGHCCLQAVNTDIKDFVLIELLRRKRVTENELLAIQSMFEQATASNNESSDENTERSIDSVLDPLIAELFRRSRCEGNLDASDSREHGPKLTLCPVALSTANGTLSVNAGSGVALSNLPNHRVQPRSMKWLHGLHCHSGVWGWMVWGRRIIPITGILFLALYFWVSHLGAAEVFSDISK